MRFTQLVVRRPIGTIALMALALVFGALSLKRLPVDLLPDVKYPMIKIHVFWPGATPEEVEDEIADPLESIVSTIDNLDYMQSVSKEGMYRLFVNFIFGTDQDVAFQDVLAKLSIVQKNLPEDIDPPVVMKSDPSQLPIMKIAVSSDERDPVRLRTWVENYLQDRFLMVRGVASTEVVGGLKREIRINVDPERLHAYGFTFEALTKAIRDENIEMMGGRITAERREFIARTIGRFTSMRDIEDVIIGHHAGVPVTVKDVARVEDSHEEQRIFTRQNGRPCVQLSISKQSEANTVEVADGVKRKMRALAGTVPKDIELSTVYSQADYIRSSIKNVTSGAVIGALLVMAVVYLFLTGVRRVLVIVLTFPVAIAGIFIAMRLGGFNINLFSIGGLAVAFGVLLDNCIVVLENITRVQASPGQKRGKDIVAAATAEVLGPLAAGTITFVLLFVPFLFAKGTAVLFFRELVMTIAAAVVISLLCAVSVVPMLSGALLHEGAGAADSEEGVIARLSQRILESIRRPYSALLRIACARRYLTLALALSFLIGCFVVILPRTGSEFLPRLDDGQIWVKVKMPTGTAVTVTDKALRMIESAVSRLPDLASYFTLSGGREYSLLTYEIANEGQVNPQLTAMGDRKHPRLYYIKKLAGSAKKLGVPGAKVKVRPAPIKGVKGAASNDIEIKVRGPEMFTIERLCRQIMTTIKDVEGLSNLDLSLDLTRPEFQIVIDRQRARAMGLSARMIAATIKNYFYGASPSEYVDKGETYNIRVSLPDDRMTSAGDVENVLVDLPNGKFVYLKEVAEVKESHGPLEIDREGQVRQIIVQGDATGRSAGAVTADVKKRLGDISLPEGYEIEFGGQQELMEESMGSLGLVLALALLLAYTVLAIQFESFLHPLAIMLSFFAAIGGSILALWSGGVSLSTPVAVALLYVAGTTISNGVILLGYTGDLRAKGRSALQAVSEAGPLRLRPIVMTACTSIMALLPLAVLNIEGMEVLKPLAVAGIGGLIVSPVMTLLVVPSLYLIFEGRTNHSAGRMAT